MSNIITIEINEKTLILLLKKYLEEQTGQPVDMQKLKIEVKSTQNYKAEWEVAKIRGKYFNILKEPS